MPRVIFVEKDNNEKIIENAPVGLSILEIAHQNNIDLEGACGGSLACSTCHIIVDKEFCDHLPAVSEAEEDMLDLAFGLDETSRLGCQIIMKQEYDGIRLRLPGATRNIDIK